MLLSEVFEALTFGELSKVKVGGKDSGAIQAGDYPEIVTHVNAGMRELYKRFSLKTDELTLQLYSEITLYNLHTDYAETDPNTSGKTPKYILDAATPFPFTDNILLITHVYNEIGDEYYLNDLDQDESLFTPQDTVLQVPYPENDNTLAVIYRAMPEAVSHSGLTDPTTVTLALPFQFLPALTAYVAYKVFESTPTIKQGVNTGNEYYAKFVAACDLITSLGTLNTDNQINTKFESNGWV